jgi:hypothetical protein
LSIIPDEIFTKYSLQAISVGGWVYLEIRKGMYGLKQAGLLVNQLLQHRLAHYGYYPAHHTPGLWLHKKRPIAFTLAVDDFDVKYVGKYNAHHLRNALLCNYEIKSDWGGIFYSGMALKWDCQKRTCDISMPDYITNVLNKLQHDAPKYPQHTPSKYVTPIYGTKTRYVTRDETPLLYAKQCTNIKHITASVLYYARQQKKHRRRKISSWTTLQRILTPLSDITSQT